MSDIVSPLLEWLNAHPNFAGLVTFTISAAESVAIIGTIVPGSIMMTAIGTLAGAGVIPLWQTIFWAILGAIVGDGISYWIGYYFKDRLPSVWPFRKHPGLLKTGEKFFHKYGSMSVFIGRFVGPVRALVPLVAGMLGMRPLQFTIANVASAIGWAPAYMLPGILLGAASLELPPDIAMHVILVLLLLSLFVMLCLWFIYKSFQLIQVQTNQLLDNIWNYLKTSRYLSSLTYLLKYHNPSRPHGQLSLGLFFVATSALFICLALYVKITGPANITVNDAMFHLFRGINLRSDTLDSIMINITLLGQKQVILPVVVIFFAWLLIRKRWRVAFHALGLGILAAGSVFVIKNVFQTARPWGIANSPETFSMPSGHTTLSTTVFIGFAFLLAKSIRPKYRWIIYSIAFVILLLVGISRLYLGAHWFTDVISSWLLSAALLTLVIISYQRHAEKNINPIGITLVSLLALAITFGFYHHRHFEQLKISYKQINWPSFQIAMNEWWQKNDALPGYHTSLFGFPSQQINIEWVGDINQIRDTLLKEGWIRPPARDLISTLHRITGVSSTEYLPLVAPQYLDKKPALILTRSAIGQKNFLVIRLWESNRSIKETNAPLWVGIVSIIQPSYSWLYKNSPSDVEINPALVFPKKSGTASWQWKIIFMNQPTGTNKMIKQKIMLIRESRSAHKKK